MPRLRIRRYDLPRPALVLADTPKPKCPDCRGSGEVIVGGYEEPDYGLCGCWDLSRYWTLLPLPRRQVTRGWGADESPF